VIDRYLEGDALIEAFWKSVAQPGNLYWRAFGQAISAKKLIKSNSISDKMMKHMRSRKVFAGVSIIWLGVLIALSSQPNTLIPAFVSENDLIWHFILYGVFGYLVARAFIPDGQMTYWKIVCVLIFVTCNAILDEYYQSFSPGRVPSVSDALADFLGAFTVLTLMYIFKKQPASVSDK